jgi:hypothetical protein
MHQRRQRGMNKKLRKTLGQVFTFSPLAGIIYASFLNLSNIQHQILVLLLIIWANSFFLYKAWTA